MISAPLDDDVLLESVKVFEENDRNQTKAAAALKLSRSAFQNRLKVAARRGLMGTNPVLPGFVVSKTTAVLGADGKLQREFVQQKPEPGDEFKVPDGHVIKGISALVNSDGLVTQQWIKTRRDLQDTIEAIKTVVDELKKEIPRVEPTKAPAHTEELLLNQFICTDHHLGMMAWGEETGGDNYDLKIAEKLLLDWFSAAVAMAPKADTAVFAQLGDFMHHDSLESVTPTHRNVLDTDSRLQKIIRVAIRLIRHIISLLLQHHRHVHVIMASANHDPASSAWLRELLHAMYENEPRVTIDNSPDVYYAYEFGNTALFYHHGHKRKISDVDTVFAGKFREIYGRCEHSYGHIGHLHNDEVRESNLMKIERHRTLAPPDAYASSGGWLSKQDAKVITYHKEYGEVSRITLSPRMVLRNGEVLEK